MSLFGALLGDFDDDNFMGNPMNSMNMQMRNMNRLMNSMMMPDPFNMLTPFDNRFNGGNSLMERPSMLGGGGLFGFPNIPNMNRLLSADIGGNGGASFCSSSVISMSSGPDGRPQIYQATSSTKTGPGGIRETRKTVQDSSSGVKKMAIGHHIGERAHIIEKEQNFHSGQHEERQEFINLDEEEAESFDREFTTKARMHTPAIEIAGGSGHHSPHHRQYQRALPALPAPPSATTSSASSSLSSSPPVTAKAKATSAMKATSTTTTTASTPSSSSTPSSQTSSPSSLSAATRRALRNASMATARRPLRTPTSSPLALTTSGHNSTSTTTSVHPHPYNNAAARRNFRAKHSKHQHQHSSHQQQHQQQHSPQQQTTEPQPELLYNESNNTDSN